MCDTFVILPSATSDGSVLFAKNSDREPNEAQVLEYHPGKTYPHGERVTCTYLKIPQARETRWWHHEKLHRAILLDYGHRCKMIRQERDDLEISFVNQAYDTTRTGRSSFTESAFRQSRQATSKWIETVEGIPIRHQAKSSYRRFWRKQNSKAGITYSSCFNSAF